MPIKTSDEIKEDHQLSIPVYDKYGARITSSYVFNTLITNPIYKEIGKSTVGPYLISTIWLGVDHNWGPGPPLIFETMIFKSPSHADLFCCRYSNLLDAQTGHEKLKSQLEHGDFTMLRPEEES